MPHARINLTSLQCTFEQLIRGSNPTKSKIALCSREHHYLQYPYNELLSPMTNKKR